MSLVHCPECSAQISDSALTCPRCGHVVGMRRRVRLAIIVVIIMLVGALAAPAAVLFFLG